MISVHDALVDLHRIVYIEDKPTSTARLKTLADFCIQELAAGGLSGVVKERSIPGVGRAKHWDVAWEYDGKVRLAISLKSLLSNLAGTTPNRIDDLMGEVANVQLQSPEVVLGYVMIINRQRDAEDGKWTEWFRACLEGLSGRDAPAWAPGTIESYVLVEAAFEPHPRVLAGADDFGPFFDTLTARVAERNPGHALQGGAP